MTDDAAADNTGNDPDEGDEDGNLVFRSFAPHENPYGIPLLDVRPFTHTMVSFTKDPNIAESFSDQRDSDGSDLVRAPIPDAERIPCSLGFELPRPRQNGPLFKAEQMEDKWDIYHHDGKLLFARSWTGDLIFRCSLDQDSDTLVITEIEVAEQNASRAGCDVLFLVMSHLEGLAFPHTLPPDTEQDPMQIAVTSFGLFGRRASFATFDDILTMTTNPDFRDPNAEASP